MFYSLYLYGKFDNYRRVVHVVSSPVSWSFRIFLVVSSPSGDT